MEPEKYNNLSLKLYKMKPNELIGLYLELEGKQPEISNSKFSKYDFIEMLLKNHLQQVEMAIMPKDNIEYR